MLMAGYHQFHAVKAAVDETIRATGKDRTGEAEGTYWAGKMQGGAEGDRRVGFRQELVDALLRRLHHRRAGDGGSDAGFS